MRPRQTNAQMTEQTRLSAKISFIDLFTAARDVGWNSGFRIAFHQLSAIAPDLARFSNSLNAKSLPRRGAETVAGASGCVRPEQRERGRPYEAHYSGNQAVQAGGSPFDLEGHDRDGSQTVDRNDQNQNRSRRAQPYIHGAKAALTGARVLSADLRPSPRASVGRPGAHSLRGWWADNGMASTLRSCFPIF